MHGDAEATPTARTLRDDGGSSRLKRPSAGVRTGAPVTFQAPLVATNVAWPSQASRCAHRKMAVGAVPSPPGLPRGSSTAGCID